MEVGADGCQEVVPTKPTGPVIDPIFTRGPILPKPTKKPVKWWTPRPKIPTHSGKPGKD